MTDAPLAVSSRKPLQRHLAFPWPIQFHQQHILIPAQLQLSIADIHGHLIAQQQGLKVRVGIAWLIVRNAWS